MNNGPCLNCEDRKLACHSTCEKYAEYRQGRIDLSRAKRSRQRIVIDTPRYDKIRRQK